MLRVVPDSRRYVHRLQSGSMLLPGGSCDARLKAVTVVAWIAGELGTYRRGLAEIGLRFSAYISHCES